MSHFAVLVCLPGDTDLSKLEHRLAEVMAPWDENEPVKPYRNYQDGSAEEFWWVRAVRKDAAHHRDGTIDERDRTSVVYGQPDKTDDEVRAEYADAVKWEGALGEAPTTWEKVVAAYNERWGHGTALATAEDDSDSEIMYYDADSGRAYTMTTYNPESKWDCWRIGGRWRGYFVAKGTGAGLLTAEKSWDSPDEPEDDQPRCDGGPKHLVDFEAMRAAAERKAHGRYDQWEKVCQDTPTAKSWSYFIGLVDVKEMEIEHARKAYRDQPRIRKAREVELDSGWGGCVVDEFLPPREEYVTKARLGAVPAYALVTLDGQWLAPGRMGWFGMSSDGDGERDAYRIAANRYLDDLKDDRLIVVLDCHI